MRRPLGAFKIGKIGDYEGRRPSGEGILGDLDPWDCPRRAMSAGRRMV
jgi:hypothetical protein